MRVGFTADLHYGIGRWVDRRVERFVETEIAPAALDLLLIAGDVAEMEDLTGAGQGRNHLRLFERLRAALACPIGFIAGNHDLWSSDPASDSWRVYREVLPGIAAAAGVTCLDAENLRAGPLTVVGCYGHYDYSLRVPDLAIGGRLVTDEDYRAKFPPGHHSPVWMDGLKIHWPYDDPSACAAICDAGGARMDAALAGGARRIVFVTHVVPRHEVNGRRANPSPVSLFLNAFSGTARLEAIVRRAVSAGARVLAVSGHTHKAVDRVELEGAVYLNVGGTYGAPRLVVEETDA
jgi:hypothetical protein